AGRDRAGARHPPRSDLRRRAHRRPRPGHRPRDHAPARRGHQAQRRLPRRGHPRPAGGRVVRPHPRDARRQDRRHPVRHGRPRRGPRHRGTRAGVGMTGLLELSWRLLRGAGRHGMLGTVLTAAAVTVSTALLLFTIAGNVAFLARADREAWRHPVEATSGAVAIQAVAEDFVEDEVITVVTVAPLPGAERSGVHPPGLSRMPRPGEVWLSPALAELVRELPPERLANRFPGTV